MEKGDQQSSNSAGAGESIGGYFGHGRTIRTVSGANKPKLLPVEFLPTQPRSSRRHGEGITTNRVAAAPRSRTLSELCPCPRWWVTRGQLPDSTRSECRLLLSHRVQPDHVSFRVQDQGNEPMFSNRKLLALDRSAILRSAACFDGTVIADEIDDRSSHT